MLFGVHGAIFEQFPDVRIGVVWALGIDNRGESAEIAELLRQEQARLVAAFQGVPVVEHPRIAPWREAYRRFGAKPKKHFSSIENLARRTLTGEPIRHVNKLVDLYNAVSLRHLVPVGGEDLDRTEGDILLTLASQAEAPVKLLGEDEPRPPNPGEVIYKDAVGTLCRRWNWKEADRTKLTESTRNAVLVIESLPPVGIDELDAAVRDLSDLVREHCGGSARAAILDHRNRESQIPTFGPQESRR